MKVVLLLVITATLLMQTDGSTVASRSLKRKLRMERRRAHEMTSERETKLAAQRLAEREEAAREYGRNNADYVYITPDDNCTCNTEERVSFQGYSCKSNDVNQRLTTMVNDGCLPEEICVKVPDPITAAPTPAPTMCMNSVSFVDFGVADFTGSELLVPPNSGASSFVWPEQRKLPLSEWNVGPLGLEQATYYTNRENNLGLCNSVLPAGGDSFITFGSDRNTFFGDTRPAVISKSFDVSGLIGSLIEWSFSYLVLESDVLEARLLFTDINGTLISESGFTSDSGPSCNCGDSASSCADMQGAPLSASQWQLFSSSNTAVPPLSANVTLEFSTQNIMSDQSFYVYLDDIQLLIAC